MAADNARRGRFGGAGWVNSRTRLVCRYPSLEMLCVRGRACPHAHAHTCVVPVASQLGCQPLMGRSAPTRILCTWGIPRREADVLSARVTLFRSGRPLGVACSTGNPPWGHRYWAAPNTHTRHAVSCRGLGQQPSHVYSPHANFPPLSVTERHVYLPK